MAFVGTAPDLAIAVCKAGGLGSLAVEPLPPVAVRDLIKAVKAATDGPLNANFITILANEAQIRACVDESVSVVSFHWGHPPAIIERLMTEATSALSVVRQSNKQATNA
jgi:NAD(P)H-dependent flavin oxidoreductase YrpB (nitropropane dioxygenase family)